MKKEHGVKEHLAVHLESCSLSRMQDGVTIDILSQQHGIIDVATANSSFQVTFSFNDPNFVSENKKKSNGFYFLPIEIDVPVLYSLTTDGKLKKYFGASGDKYSFYTIIRNEWKLIVEAIPITKKGLSGTLEDNDEVSPGDLKINLILDCLQTENIGGEHLMYVDMEIKCETAFVLCEGSKNKYRLEGSSTHLHFTNSYYSYENESDKWEEEFMDEGFPQLSRKEKGMQIFTLQFRKSSKIFYDPNFFGFFSSNVVGNNEFRKLVSQGGALQKSKLRLKKKDFPQFIKSFLPGLPEIGASLDLFCAQREIRVYNSEKGELFLFRLHDAEHSIRISAIEAEDPKCTLEFYHARFDKNEAKDLSSQLEDPESIIDFFWKEGWGNYDTKWEWEEDKREQEKIAKSREDERKRENDRLENEICNEDQALFDGIEFVSKEAWAI